MIAFFIVRPLTHLLVSCEDMSLGPSLPLNHNIGSSQLLVSVSDSVADQGGGLKVCLMATCRELWASALGQVLFLAETLAAVEAEYPVNDGNLHNTCHYIWSAPPAAKVEYETRRSCPST